MKPAVLTRYRAMAYITGVWLLLFCVEMIVKYVFGVDVPGALSMAIAQIHGLLFMIYLVVTFDLSQKMRWAPKRMLTLMVAGTIPLASFFAEKKAVAEVHASGKLESAAPAGV